MKLSVILIFKMKFLSLLVVCIRAEKQRTVKINLTRFTEFIFTVPLWLIQVNNCDFDNITGILIPALINIKSVLSYFFGFSSFFLKLTSDRKQSKLWCAVLFHFCCFNSEYASNFFIYFLFPN